MKDIQKEKWPIIIDHLTFCHFNYYKCDWYETYFKRFCFVFLTSRSSITQQSLSNSSAQNLENEYIKQLQEQIYYLETECLYLYPFFLILEQENFYFFII